MTKLLFNNKNSSYKIIIDQNSIRFLRKEIKNISPYTKKIALIYDKKIPSKLINKVRKQIKSYKVYNFAFLVSEKLKSFNNVKILNEGLLKYNLNRDDLILVIGGGVLSDFAGFAASIIKRGINFINMPTTLLAQVDASIGGKTGLNTNSGKNLIGTFYQPMLVIIDTNFLKSLPRREIICGFAEILKHSLIKDKKFFFWIKKNSVKIIEHQNLKTIKDAIIKSCKIKIHFVKKDEKEKGDRAILNFGHTFAHGIEAANGYSGKINHGEAVLIGMYLATKLSAHKKICSINTLNILTNFYKENKLFHYLKKNFLKRNISKIVNYMKSDKKNKNSKINLILIKEIGKTTKPNKIQIKPELISQYLRKSI